MQYRTTSHQYMIRFFWKTRVTEFVDEGFPSLMYDLMPFSQLTPSNNPDENLLIDVIGKIATLFSPQTREIEGRNTKVIDFILEDLENRQLTCTLWNEYADEIVSRMKNQESDQVVVILQMCRPKKFRGEIKVSNTYNVTKIIVDKENAEIIAFKNRLDTSHKPTMTISSTSIAGMTVNDEFSSGRAVIRTVRQLNENVEVGNFWICARIIAIETVGQWFYLSCNSCTKKISANNGKFFCVICNKSDISGRLRYKIQVRVNDGDDNAPFLLWDRECVELIGKTATDLRAENLEENINHMPAEIESIVGKELFFKVQVKEEHIGNYYEAYTVVKVTCDNNIISNYSGTNNDKEDSDIFSKLRTAEDSAKEKTASSEEVTTPLKKSSNGEKSESANTDCNVKRALMDEFSSSAANKKLKMVIKQEK